MSASDTPDPAASALDGIRERHTLAVTPDPGPVFFGALFQIKSHLVRTDVPRLLAAVEAALKAADDLEAPSIGNPPTKSQIAVTFRAAITAALAGKEAD